MKLIFILLLVASILRFYSTKELIIQERDLTNENVVVNTSYQFVMLFPYIFLWSKSKALPLSFLIVISFFVINGAKRGAFVCLAISVLIYMVYSLRGTSLKKLVRNIISSLLIIPLVLAFLYRFITNNEYLIYRLKNIDDGSGRSDIFVSLFDFWINSDQVLNQAFGFGLGSTVKYIGIRAHNDWLEILISLGLLGLFNYLLIFTVLIYTIKNNNIPTQFRFSLLCILSTWLLISLFSMGYNNSNTSIMLILLGFILGNKDRNHSKPTDVV